MNKYRDKVVLITGHTGFKGSWLSIWLKSVGAKVVGLSDCIPSFPSNYEASSIDAWVEDHRVDIRNTDLISSLINNIQPDFVFHLAAQALVRPSYINPLETINVNAIGTANLLEALRKLNKQVVAVLITSDKVYDNFEWVWGYRETDRLGGKDPYSASKSMAELVIRTYFESYFTKPGNNVLIGIARAGNVIGGGDWAVDRIVPDCMRAWSKGEVVEVRNPKATRPWQHVLEPLSGYLLLGKKLSESKALHGESFNFGPPANQDHSVEELINLMSTFWGNVRWKDTSSGLHLQEAGFLKLNCDKALDRLTWQPTLGFYETVKMTVDWYKTFYESNGESMKDFALAQINDYSNLALSKDINWAII